MGEELRRTRRKSVLKAAACTAGVLMASACSQPAENAEHRPANRDVTKRFDEKDPATWSLPVEAYLPTDDEDKQLSRAREALVSACMKDFGFDWKAAPDLPELGPKTLTDWRYGIHDLALTKKRGYKPDAAEQVAYDAAVQEGAVDEDESPAEATVLNGDVKKYDGKKVPQGGCSGRADRTLSGGKGSFYSDFAEDLGNEAFVRSMKEPKVVAVFGQWSACMKKHGYSYKAPLDASDDPRFSAPEVTPEEIATATADIGCRKRYHVAKTWYETEVRLQNKAIEKNEERLSDAKDRLDIAVKRAAKTLAEKG
ncbi:MULTISPECIES: hypothetical protein [Streptomyces]|nr:hypothetical protein [Streptomyces alboflavus]